MSATRYELPEEKTWAALLDLCLRAGDSIRRHYEQPELAGKLRAKADDSPLTRADLASHEILLAGLNDLSPQLPVLSEESEPAVFAARRDWTRFWMVDPLDGTREFLERSGEFTINVALIDEHRAVAGLIYQPLEERAYLGVIGRGAWCFRRREGHWQSEALATSPLGAETMIVLSSRRHRNERLRHTLEWLAAHRRLERRNSGSALKFCDLAAGRGDCYPRFSPCSEWDVAAGDALVNAAGGSVLGLDGKPLAYNARQTLLAEPFLAFGDPTQTLWSGLLDSLSRRDD